MANILCDIDPKLEYFIIKTRDKQKLMYGQLNKEGYGILLDAILFYKKLAGKLVDWRYNINPCDPCALNKMINGKKITIQVFIDDCITSSKWESDIKQLVTMMDKKFRTKAKELTVTRGKLHEYLGITIDFAKDDCLLFTMYNYIEDVLKETTDNMNGIAVTSASDNLFQVDTIAIRLDDKMAEYFHCMTVQLLFVSKRAQPDIQVAFTFLCTCVKASNVDDYKNLTCVIKYLREIIHLPLLIGWDESRTLTWSLDAAFAVHKDMRSHMGALLTMGIGSVISLFLKQQINKKISTEAELVGVDDAMNFVVWAKLFFD